jgi:anti-repressor protein
MNELQKVFSYNGAQVRTVMVNDEPWFIAKDVCEVLELDNVTRAIERLDDDEKDLTTIQTLGGIQETNVVSESGLYSMVLTSRKPEAKQFKRWVTHEVLPSIRKHGMYATDNVIEKVLDDPDFGIKLLSQLKEERQKRREAEQIIAQQKPLVGFAEHVSVSTNSILVRELAKIASKQGILIGEKRLYNTLREWGMICKNSTEPKQEYIEKGYFEVIEGVTETSKGTITHRTTRVTGKGQIHIVGRLQKDTHVKSQIV